MRRRANAAGSAAWRQVLKSKARGTSWAWKQDLPVQAWLRVGVLAQLAAGCDERVLGERVVLDSDVWDLVNTREGRTARAVSSPPLESFQPFRD